MKFSGMLVLALFLTCGTVWATGHRASSGTLIGAGTGALIGSQIGEGSGQLVAIAVGTLAGAMIGQDVGRSMDRSDHLTMQYSSQQALERARTNSATSWVNPDTGHAGSLIPLRTYRNYSGQYCREYQQIIDINGQRQQAYGTACRQPDGAWHLVEPQQQVQVRQVTRVRSIRSDPYRYSSGYWPGYYAPASILWSFGYFSGHRHDRGSHFFGRRGGGHRGSDFGRHGGRGYGHGKSHRGGHRGGGHRGGRH